MSPKKRSSQSTEEGADQVEEMETTAGAEGGEENVNTETSSGEPDTKKAKVEETNGTETDEKKRPPELAKFWKAVEDDPTDFTGWTYLLQYADSSADEDQAREAFDAFLFRYPYCYGYWKKYADLEKRKLNKEKCMLVFERGIKAIPLSVDLWIHYLNHVKIEYSENPEFIRAQYERALSACGREWRSDKLWDNYVKWELKEQKDLEKVMKLYDRIFRNPTVGVAHQFEVFQEFVKEHNPKDILDVNEFLALRKEVLEDLSKKQGNEDKPMEGKDEGGAPGEDDSKVRTDEENAAMREKIIVSRKKILKETEEASKGRLKFEDNIKRPYFHTKPLERGQLKNWKEYLDYEIEEQSKDGGDDSLVEVLFERCLIACALYEEFWLKYAKWIKNTRKDITNEERVEKLRDIFSRACTHHLPQKVDINVNYAAFEEENGDFDKAAEILKKAEEKHPEMLSLMVRRINLERRRGNLLEVNKSYRSCIAKAKKGTKSDLAVKYSRFLRLCQNDSDEAEKIIKEALIEDEKNPKLYLQLLDSYLHEPPPLNLDKIKKLFETAQEKCTTPKAQLLFSQRRLEFLEDFGMDIKELLAAQEAHLKLSNEIKKANSEAENAESATGKATANGDEAGSGIKTIEGRSASKKTTNGAGTTTYPATTNSASYEAHHTSQYQQYGSRYSGQYGGYYPGSYPGYPGYPGYGSHPSY